MFFTEGGSQNTRVEDMSEEKNTQSDGERKIRERGEIHMEVRAENKEVEEDEWQIYN